MFSGLAALGECVPERVCPFFDCEQATQLFPPEFNIDMETCAASCCDTDLCNAPVIPYGTAFPDSRTSPSTTRLISEFSRIINRETTIDRERTTQQMLTEVERTNPRLEAVTRPERKTFQTEVVDALEGTIQPQLIVTDRATPPTEIATQPNRVIEQPGTVTKPGCLTESTAIVTKV